MTGTSSSQPPRARARDLGVAPGELATGVLNAITDVPDVRVGQLTMINGDTVRTGVTAILPHPGNLYQQKVRAGIHVGNGYAKTAGAIQIGELGTIETPIVLTNTLNVAAGIDGAIGWTLARPGNEQVTSVNAIVGETNDGVLNDIRGRHLTAPDVVRAIEEASDGPVAEGSIGAGTGTVAFGWKGGIGTSSRIVGDHTIGVLVQSNYGGSLRIDGLPVGHELSVGDAADAPGSGDGSCMIIIGTDAPLDAGDLERVAARAIFAMARTGSSYSNGSGDVAIAFSTSRTIPDRQQNAESSRQPDASAFTGHALSPLFVATLDATEEAIYNSLFAATTVTGNGGTTRHAIPLDRVRTILERHRPS